MNRLKLTAAALGVATFTVGLGWWTAIWVDASDNNARVALIAAAAVGTVALIGAAATALSAREFTPGLFLFIVALASPTGFAYLPNLIVIVFSLALTLTAFRGKSAEPVVPKPA